MPLFSGCPNRTYLADNLNFLRRGRAGLIVPALPQLKLFDNRISEYLDFAIHQSPLNKGTSYVFRNIRVGENRPHFWPRA